MAKRRPSPVQAGPQSRQVGREVLPHLGMLQGELHGRLQIAQLVSAVEASSPELPGDDRLPLQQLADGVGELDLATSASGRALDEIEDGGRENLTPHDGQVGGRLAGLGFLDHAFHTTLALVHGCGLHDAVAICLGLILM